MSSLRFEKKLIPSANFGGGSTLPSLPKRFLDDFEKKHWDKDEDEELFLGYGAVSSVYPYKMQDSYDRELRDTEYDVAVLENENLKATFFPGMGGKLWSLIDKRTDRELLFCNDVVRPCNLAVRNAWTSGGIEWNMGFLGHGPYTCSLVNTAKTTLADGTPVLRFYYFERIRACITQMDIFLPDGADSMFVRTRITNPNDEVVPMYWWSNVATIQEDGCRVIVPAMQSYISDKGCVKRVGIPYFNGTDISYPLNNRNAFDYFWKTEPESLKYICQVDANGYGLLNTSTERLKGRKLFVWGNSQGGSHWMNFLTADDKAGSYNEIQCGIANLQLECLPMPGKTVWEWVETYGSIQADKNRVHSDWKTARNEIEQILAAKTSKAALQSLLDETRDMAKSAAEPVFLTDGWAALEQQRRKISGCGDMMCDHLHFAEIGKEQEVWLSLLQHGTVGCHAPEEVPLSYNIQEPWRKMLVTAIQDKDKDNWYAYYLLGTAEAALDRCGEAKRLLTKSLELKPSAWANYALATIATRERDTAGCVAYMRNAYELRRDDLSLVKEYLRSLCQLDLLDEVTVLYENASAAIQSDKRCMLFYAYALGHTGRIVEANNILCNDKGYLVVPDIREGELMVTDLWFYLQEQKGIPKDKIGQPPYALDFRMSYNIAEDK